MSRLLAFLLAGAIAAPAVAANSLFQCNLDGQMRLECCCEHAAISPDARPTPSVEIQNQDCCDLIVRPQSAEALAKSDSAALVSAPILVLALFGAHAAPQDACRRYDVRTTRAPVQGAGGSLLYQRCSFLI